VFLIGQTFNVCRLYNQVAQTFGILERAPAAYARTKKSQIIKYHLNLIDIVTITYFIIYFLNAYMYLQHMSI
jgi:hypothetical protein